MAGVGLWIATDDNLRRAYEPKNAPLFRDS